MQDCIGRQSASEKKSKQSCFYSHAFLCRFHSLILLHSFTLADVLIFTEVSKQSVLNNSQGNTDFWVFITDLGFFMLISVISADFMLRARLSTLVPLWLLFCLLTMVFGCSQHSTSIYFPLYEDSSWKFQLLYLLRLATNTVFS